MGDRYLRMFQRIHRYMDQIGYDAVFDLAAVLHRVGMTTKKFNQEASVMVKKLLRKIKRKILKCKKKLLETISPTELRTLAVDLIGQFGNTLRASMNRTLGRQRKNWTRRSRELIKVHVRQIDTRFRDFENIFYDDDE